MLEWTTNITNAILPPPVLLHTTYEAFIGIFQEKEEGGKGTIYQILN